MIRTLAYIQRRPDRSREFFRDYYETQHAPLGASFLTGLGLYVRNHVLEERGEAPLPFDVITEFEYASLEDVEAIQKLLASEAGQPIRDDEDRFMHKPGNSFFSASRGAVSGERPEPGRALKAMAVMRSGEGGDRAALAARAREVGKGLVRDGGAIAAEVDVGVEGDPMGPPAWDVVLHTWWPEPTAPGVALDGLGERLAGAPVLRCLHVAEHGSLDFDYATEYPDR